MPYHTATGIIEEGDLLLWRGSHWSLADRLIMGVGRSPYVHAAMVGWAGRWTVLEMLQWYGGRESSLEEQVLRWPGRWDLYRTNPDRRWPRYNPAVAADRMRQFVGTRYGWCNVVRVGLRYLPLVRLLVRPRINDQATAHRPPFCSHAVSVAAKLGGVDPVQNLEDRLTEPADLSRSLFFRYLCTLV